MAFNINTFTIMTFRKITHSIMTFNIDTLTKMTHIILTLKIMALRITTLRVMTSAFRHSPQWHSEYRDTA